MGVGICGNLMPVGIPGGTAPHPPRGAGGIIGIPASLPGPAADPLGIIVYFLLLFNCN